MIWGKYTWYFFHTLAEKIREEHFDNNRENLITIFKEICAVLPCPTCRAHAVESNKKVNWSLIRTKEDFKNFIFAFHNKISIKKRVRPAEIDALEQYKRANFRNVILMFRDKFQTKIPQLMTEEMHRKYILNKNIKFIINNQHIFMP